MDGIDTVFQTITISQIGIFRQIKDDHTQPDLYPTFIDGMDKLTINHHLIAFFKVEFDIDHIIRIDGLCCFSHQLTRFDYFLYFRPKVRHKEPLKGFYPYFFFPHIIRLFRGFYK